MRANTREQQLTAAAAAALQWHQAGSTAAFLAIGHTASGREVAVAPPQALVRAARFMPDAQRHVVLMTRYAFNRNRVISYTAATTLRYLGRGAAPRQTVVAVDQEGVSAVERDLRLNPLGMFEFGRMRYLPTAEVPQTMTELMMPLGPLPASIRRELEWWLEHPALGHRPS